MTEYTELELFEIIEEYGGKSKKEYLESKCYLKDGYLRKGTGIQKTFERQLLDIFNEVNMKRKKKGQPAKYEVGEMKSNIKVVGDGRKNNKRQKSNLDYKMSELMFQRIASFLDNKIGSTYKTTLKGWIWKLNYPISLKTNESYLDIFDEINSKIVKNNFESEMENQAKNNIISIFNILNEQGKIELKSYEELYVDEEAQLDVTEDEILYFKEMRKAIFSKYGISFIEYYKRTKKVKKCIDKIHSELYEETGYTDCRKYIEIKLLEEATLEPDILSFLDIYYEKLNYLFTARHDKYQIKISDCKNKEEHQKHNTFFKRLFKHHMFYLIDKQGSFKFMEDDQQYKTNVDEAIENLNNVDIYNIPSVATQDKNMNMLNKGFCITNGFIDETNKNKVYSEYKKMFGHRYYQDAPYKINVEDLPF